MEGLTIAFKRSVIGPRGRSAKWTMPSTSTSPTIRAVSHSILTWPSWPGGITGTNLAAIPAADRSTRAMVRGAGPSFRTAKAWTIFSPWTTVPKSWLRPGPPGGADWPDTGRPTRPTIPPAASAASPARLPNRMLCSSVGRRTGGAAGPSCPTVGVPVLRSEEIEPKLGQLQLLVVELPEEILETARKQRDALEDPVTVDVDHDGGQLVGHILEGRLAGAADEQHIFRRAHGLAGGRVCRTCRHRRPASRFSQTPRPDFVRSGLAAGARERRDDVRVAWKLEGRSLSGDPGPGAIEGGIEAVPVADLEIALSQVDPALH